MLKMGFKVTGDIYKDIRNHARKMERGSTLAARATGRGLKTALRDQVKRAGLGPKVGNAWREQSYPKGGKHSLNAASIVWTKAPRIIAAYDRGVVIRARQGIYLAIPTENTPFMSYGRGARGKASPANWPESRFGKLRFVRLDDGKAMLVADNLRKSYAKKTGKYRGYKKATKRMVRAGTDIDNVVMFILIPQARIPKKLDVEREFKKWSAEFRDLLSRNIHHGH